MPNFHYKAKNEKAETVSGKVFAENKAEAIDQIGHMKLVPVTVEEEVQTKISRRLGSGKVSLKELYNFSRQLSSLLKAGIPLIRALQIIQDQVSNAYFHKILGEISAEIKNGKTFSDALTHYPKVFSYLFVAMVRAGEEGGSLREMLLNISEYQKNQIEINSKVSTALAYPLVMLILGVTTVLFMFIYVMPKITGLFDGTQKELPLPTTLVLGISEFLRHSWMGLLLVFFVILFFYLRWIKSAKGRKVIDKMQLKIPIYNNFILKLELARFCRTLHLLIASGISLLRAMQLASRLVSNECVRSDLNACLADLAAGSSFGQGLKKSQIIPSIMGDLIAIGEESGSLVDSLKDIAESYEQETNEILKVITTLLEPLMIVVVGGIIGFIVFSVLLPIFQMDVFAI